MNVQTGNPQISKPGQRRQFRWGKQERDLVLSQLNASAIHFSALISSLEQMSGNPRWACRRFARALGVKARRTQRNWTSQERQRLVKLLDLYPVPEISRLLRRSESSIWHMVSRVGANAKIGRDSFTIYSLAFALHVRPEKVQDWIARGWLKTRDVETTAGFRTVIEADPLLNVALGNYLLLNDHRGVGAALEYINIDPFVVPQPDWQSVVDQWVTQDFSNPDYARIDGKPLLYVIDSVRFTQQWGGAAGVNEALSTLRQAAIAHGLVDRGVGQLVVAGGETAGACVQALGVEQLRIGPQIDPGVPWCHAPVAGRPHGLHLALKSGNFGGDDFFSRAFSILS